MKCLFSCFILNKADVSWTLVVRNSSHNYLLIIENAHFALKKLAIIFETMSKVNYQNKTQAISTQVLIFMRLENEDCILRSRDIYNVEQSIRRNLNLWHQLNFFWKIWNETIDIIDIKLLFWRMKLLICFSSRNISSSFWKRIEKWFWWIVSTKQIDTNFRYLSSLIISLWASHFILTSLF